jgi:hypothetical protein
MKNYALFSTNGRFIGFTNFKPQNGLYKEMPDSFDPVMQVYVGDYETGGLKHVHELQVKDYREANIDKKWKVLESDLNNNTGKRITDGMDIPLYKQLNAIMEVLHLNREKLQMTQAFEDIYKTIDRVRYNHTNALKSYEQAPKADVVKKEEERLFFEEYTQKQLNINDEPVRITVEEK